jgi:hypothetical protein
MRPQDFAQAHGLQQQTDEFVTIIAPSTREVMEQFKAQGLDRQGFTIAGRIGPHRFSMVDGEGSAELFEGRGLMAGTFARKISA